MPGKKEIIYPVFLECSTFADNKFWVNIFQDLAYGKTPYGTYISKDFLCCNYKNKEFSYKIESKPPQQIYDEIYSLLTKKMGFLSEKERARKMIEFHRVEQEIKGSRQTWADIRKKNIKEAFIERYVIKMKHKHKLSVKQSKLLLSVIFTAMTFKILTTKDIVYTEKGIERINGIRFDKGRVRCEKSLYDVPFERKKVSDNCAYMSDQWKKYLVSLRKMVVH